MQLTLYIIFYFLIFITLRHLHHKKKIKTSTRVTLLSIINIISLYATFQNHNIFFIMSGIISIIDSHIDRYTMNKIEIAINLDNNDSKINTRSQGQV